LHFFILLYASTLKPLLPNFSGLQPVVKLGLRVGQTLLPSDKIGAIFILIIFINI